MAVSRNTQSPISCGTLKGHNALFVAHPASPSKHKGCGGKPVFLREEIKAVENFVAKGGGLVVLNEYMPSQWGSNLNELVAPFGVSFNDDIVTVPVTSGGSRKDLQQFVTKEIRQHPTTEHVGDLSYLAGCSCACSVGSTAKAIVLSPTKVPLALAAEHGCGRVVIVGDTDLFAEPYVGQNDNATFIVNILQWVTGANEIQHFPRAALRRATPQPKIFISYAREDREQVTQLYQALELFGLEPWMDTESLLPGQEFEREIMRAIRSSDFFIICLSRNSVSKRGFVQKEWKAGLDIAKSYLDEDIFMIPVKLDDCDVPAAISHIQWLELYAPNSLEKLGTVLRRGIEVRCQ